MKTRFSWLLCALVCSVGIAGHTAVAAPKQESAASAAAPTVAPAGEVVVYYFHGRARCYSCRLIESYAEEAVRTQFKDAIEAGRVDYRAVNVEAPENRHFITDYQLYGKAIVVVEEVEGQQTRWKNLERIWQLVRNKDAFQAYIEEEVAAYLAEAS